MAYIVFNVHFLGRKNTAGLWAVKRAGSQTRIREDQRILMYKTFGLARHLVMETHPAPHRA